MKVDFFGYMTNYANFINCIIDYYLHIAIIDCKIYIACFMKLRKSIYTITKCSGIIVAIKATGLQLIVHALQIV